MITARPPANQPRAIPTSVFLLAITTLLVAGNMAHAQKIDRKAVVSRHNVILTAVDTLSSLTVGNGAFAFTVDATGLQSFPEYYAGGIPLGTQSDWGWHEFPNTAGYKYNETLKEYNFNGDNKGGYAVQWKSGRNQQAADYFRENPHRLQLGNIGLEITKKDGTTAGPEDLQEIHQQLDLWTGVIVSHFAVEGIPAFVITVSDAAKDVIGVKIMSPLLSQHRIKIKFRFPYPTNEFADKAVNYTHAAQHQTLLSRPSASNALFTRRLDKTTYYVAARWTGTATLDKVADHDFSLTPPADSNFELSVSFSPAKPAAGAASKPTASAASQAASVAPKPPGNLPSFHTLLLSSSNGWKKFWQSGAAIDLAGSTDPRASELERRIILSEYLTRVQCAGNTPPQETGLTYNSWYGRPHMEMYWWHTAHFAFWGRAALMEKSMQWYFKAFEGAKAIAQRQGYKGVRWQKMTDNKGNETPSNVGSFLLWQQPHVIYQAELIYRNHPSKQTLQKYQQLIAATADFMASFAHYDPSTHRYNLGKGIIPAQESHNKEETFNSPYELAYWKWALQVAQKWRSRLGLPPDKTWQTVIDHLAPLAQKDGVYRAAENVEDSYSPDSKYTIDHPAVLAALSTLPANNTVDTAVMHRTYDLVEKAWHWEHTWGWDFPMAAMTATRLHQPEAAMDDLFRNVTTNTFLPNGHNYQNKRLTLYLPGNGSLLSAIALLCAGYDGNTIPDPGFPKNGKWKVRWEGFKRLP